VIRGDRWRGVGEQGISKLETGVRDAPISTAPTEGWSSTQRVAMFAMLSPPWRSAMTRRQRKSDWKSAQVPQALTIMSRYCLPCQKSHTMPDIDSYLALRRRELSRIQIWFRLVEPLVGEEAAALKRR
jgi:hypothetical protein